MRATLGIDGTRQPLAPRITGVEHQRRPVGILLYHRQFEGLSADVFPRLITALHPHEVEVYPLLGVVNAFAGMVDVRHHDRVTRALGEPGIPGVVGDRICGLGLVLQDRDGRCKRPTVVGGLLVDPIAAMRAVPVEEVDIAVFHLDELAVGAEWIDVVEHLPL